MQDFRNTGFAQPVDSSVVDPQLSGDAEVRLADGRRLDGKVQGGFRPDRAMRLKQADGREVMVQPGDLRTNHRSDCTLPHRRDCSGDTR